MADHNPRFCNTSGWRTTTYPRVTKRTGGASYQDNARTGR
jgi:hypothetical protein